MGFFDELKKKTERKADRNFDQRFWAKFEGEFGESRSRGFFAVFWRRAGGLMVAGALAVAVVYGWGFRAARVIEDQAEQAQLLADQELIENLEVLGAMDAPELAELEDDEWDMLLAEGGDDGL